MSTKASDITYSLFVETATHLQSKTGKIPSIREIQKQIGGSNSTLLKYQQQWKSESAIASTVDDTIPAHLKQALLATIGEATQKTRLAFEEQIAQERQQVEESYELLKEAENQIATLEAQQQADAEKLIASEKRLAAEQSLTKELRSTIEKLEKQVSTLQNVEKNTKIEASNAKSLLESTEKNLLNALQRVDSLQQKIEGLQKEVHDAQVSAAVATARLEEKQKK